ncbi:unnamed protein product [Rotaria magnacalcarata]|uniref:Uncharacterized protein n=2 Tax=Rotaria magnacalcarata TaxID=392030 RepID=A0A816Y9B0_9BILA|nr:unnamed protein product [Rotaria magnacalcarata]
MHFQLLLSLFVLLSCSTSSITLNDITDTMSVSTCTKQAQCPTTHFCNNKQRICMLKYAVNSSCEHDLECDGEKCFYDICRQLCVSDSDCSLTKEYCSISKYCTAKYCGMCLRDAHCANNRCHFFHCTSTDCTTALEAINKQT